MAERPNGQFQGAKAPFLLEKFMTDKTLKDFHMMHYVYYFSNSTQRGEGNLYLATAVRAGVRKADISNATEQVRLGLTHLSEDVIVVPTSISYLGTCTTEEFNAS